MPKSITSSLFFVFETFFVIFLDQLSKKIVLFYFPDRLFCNMQLALGINLPLGLFWPSLIFFLGCLLILIWKKPSFFLFLVLGGAISNLMDRLSVGCVLDWIALYQFPIFNLADIAISFGMLGFFWQNRKNFVLTK